MRPISYFAAYGAHQGVFIWGFGRTGITKHLLEHGLGKYIQALQGLNAFITELVGLVQDSRNPPLLIKGRERNRNPLSASLRELAARCSCEERPNVIVL